MYQKLCAALTKIMRTKDYEVWQNLSLKFIYDAQK